MVVGVILGGIIWLMFSLNTAHKNQNFSYKKFFELNWMPFVLNLICGLTILWFKEDIKEFMPITKVYSVIIGMSGQAIFKKIVGVFDKKIETKLGINKSR